MYIYISHVNVTQTVPDISPLMPMHQDPLLVNYRFVKFRDSSEDTDGSEIFPIEIIVFLKDWAYIGTFH